MQIDVPTLYYLIVGTTLVAACLTVCERRFNASHRRDLGFWAIGYVLIAIGCALRIADPLLPRFLTIGVSNVGIGWGYGVMAIGTLRFLGASVPRLVPAALAVFSIAWLAVGYHQAMPLRIVATSLPIGLCCAWVAHALLTRNPESRRLPSQTLAGALFAVHAAFYLLRALVTVADLGAEIAFLGTNIVLTLFEGILWSAAAPMALLVLAREKTESRLLAVSHTDYLTALDNRRAFFEKGEQMLRRAARSGESAVLLAFDLDHFKTINDRFGHGVGDEVLKLFGTVARGVLGPEAVLSRLGGEEFAALLTESDGAKSAHGRASEIARRFSAEALQNDGLGLKVTASIGLAESRPGQSDLAALLSAADVALYRAKANGRNRIEWSVPERRAA